MDLTGRGTVPRPVAGNPPLPGKNYLMHLLPPLTSSADGWGSGDVPELLHRSCQAERLAELAQQLFSTDDPPSGAPARWAVRCELQQSLNGASGGAPTLRTIDDAAGVFK